MDRSSSTSEATKGRARQIIRTSWIGIITNVLLAGFKAAVGILASSVAIVMDARQQPERCTDERNTSENHWKVIERHGFTKYFPVDIMDEYDEIRIYRAEAHHSLT